MPAAETSATLQRFLAAVAGIEQSRFAQALLGSPEQYAAAFHQQIGDPKRPVSVDPTDAETIRRILALATDSDGPVTLTAVGSALLLASAAKAVPQRLPGDWRDARGRISDYLAQTGPLPSAPTAAGDETDGVFREPREVTREEILRTVIEGGIHPAVTGDSSSDDLAGTFAAWRSAPPFFALVEQVVLASLADLLQTLSAMRQHIVQPAVTALASSAAPVARPFDPA